ncbi:Endoribonuclease L-PSP [Suillus clintonianus]|uniref:Endoribonuclease L-PSP n=1 Tax=Suillus clintonianus TaxID=1904413 RepID=UPI001B882A43|nr:Endoribonuclease L-PSP [Suillus clintonianus]KAG2130261.1 Endoribonuclease L-PSP [Suillus clintonianus]
MPKEIVFTADAVPPLATLSQAIISKGFVYVSGNVGCTNDFLIVEGGIQAQTFAALENLSKVLTAAGSGLQHVVKTNIYLANMSRDYSEMNKVYQSFFDANAMPARTCVGVASLPLGASVEIECVAEVPDA